ncbi:hypothetical protein C2S51_005849 [Perilla frutescens var. frutescens]|nr:hypothetical protein C2S51_005849 [Perilla frutescens var. frutescens]
MIEDDKNPKSVDSSTPPLIKPLPSATPPSPPTSEQLVPPRILYYSSKSIMDNKEHIEKFKKYEAEFKQYLMSKYFSDKTIFGGNIFDVKMNIDGQTITASRLPPYQSYLDPATFDEMISKGSSSSAETPATSNSNGKPST